MTPTVHSLRKSGHKVRVNHRRRFFDPVNKRWCLMTKYERTLAPLPDFVKADEKGGETEICVISPKGTEFKGRTICSKKEAFNRKEGVKYALADLFKNVLEFATEGVTIKVKASDINVESETVPLHRELPVGK